MDVDNMRESQQSVVRGIYSCVTNDRPTTGISGNTDVRLIRHEGWA